jgi:hypothetical protein
MPDIVLRSRLVPCLQHAIRCAALAGTAVIFLFNTVPARAFSVGDLIYPSGGINSNIDNMEEALNDLIENFGETVDESTLRALQQALASVQSARFIYSDVLDETMDAVGDQRSALMMDLATQIVELEKFANNQTNTLAEAEQRFSNTIAEATRAPKIPFVLGVDPQMYRPDRDDPTHIRVTLRGQHLGDPGNRLRVEGVDYEPVINQSNTIAFDIDRNRLLPGGLDFAAITFVAIAPDPAWFPWLPWHEAPSPLEYKLSIRAAASNVGSYKVETTISSPGGTSTPDPDSMRVENAVKKIMCVKKRDDEVFDTGYTSYRIMQNIVVRKAYILYFPPPLNSAKKIKEERKDGSARAVEMIQNTPEKICFRFNSPPEKAQKQQWKKGAIIPGTNTTIRIEVTYRVRETSKRLTPWSKSGEISWDKDTAIVLPDESRGFRATVSFTDAANDVARVFTRPETYGPLEIRFDPDTHTLTFRPRLVD